ncbi:chemotaxis protein CheB [Sabulicella rubraurantiaca]|uniref:chemotaxis protein CheB n=1 Tax=Sabulicella rubraurantiaca TaxID=2811429 RepID=UPI001A97CC7B|nr:chemotaxis protein CheB [Sabulicella rubraurantiaca]
METRDLVLVGASAGGVPALTLLCAELPTDLPAAVLVVQHIAPSARSLLPAILSRAGTLPAVHATEGMRIRHGQVYVAPPDLHMLVAPDGRHLLVRHGPIENRTRPAVDALFRSAAIAAGHRSIGVVLTGMLDDGTAGMVALKGAGSINVVQAPEDAQWPDMPRSALEGDTPDHCVPLAEIAPLLARLTRLPAGEPREPSVRLRLEASIAAKESFAMSEEATPIGQPSALSCPQCGGVLNEIEEGRITRFRCQIGHAYSPLALAASQEEGLEHALSIAVRTHRERHVLFRRMERSARARGLTSTAERWARLAEEAEASAKLIAEAAIALRQPMAPLPEDPVAS